ncbi:MAG: hypothetical protein AAFX90_22345 [Pseudomonadota bacterium]
MFTVFARGLAASLISVVAIAPALAGSRDVTMHVENNTSYDFTNLQLTHQQVNIKYYSTTVTAGTTGTIKFDWDDNDAKHAKVEAVYTLPSDSNDLVKLHWEAEMENNYGKYKYTCSISQPNNVSSSHNDCANPDPHFILKDKD